MVCQRCQSERVMSINSKCSDCFDVSYNGKSYQGYVIYDMNIGGGD